MPRQEIWQPVSDLMLFSVIGFLVGLTTIFLLGISVNYLIDGRPFKRKHLGYVIVAFVVVFIPVVLYSLRWDLIWFCYIGLAIFLLGFSANYLIGGGSFKRKHLGYIVVAFVMVCIPTILNAYGYYSATGQIDGLATVIPSLFLAGFASEKFAKLTVSIDHPHDKHMLER